MGKRLALLTFVPALLGRLKLLDNGEDDGEKTFVAGGIAVVRDSHTYIIL